jgi:hypothetical protein
MSSHWPWYLLSVLIWVLTDHVIYCPYWYESHWLWYLLSVFIWVLTDHDIYCPYLYEFSLTMIFTVRIYMSSHWPWYLLSIFIWVLTYHDIYCPYLYEFSLTMIFTVRIYMVDICDIVCSFVLVEMNLSSFWSVFGIVCVYQWWSTDKEEVWDFFNRFNTSHWPLQWFDVKGISSFCWY